MFYKATYLIVRDFAVSSAFCDLINLSVQDYLYIRILR